MVDSARCHNWRQQDAVLSFFRERSTRNDQSNHQQSKPQINWKFYQTKSISVRHWYDPAGGGTKSWIWSRVAFICYWAAAKSTSHTSRALPHNSFRDASNLKCSVIQYCLGIDCARYTTIDITITDEIVAAIIKRGSVCPGNCNCGSEVKHAAPPHYFASTVWWTGVR